MCACVSGGGFIGRECGPDFKFGSGGGGFIGRRIPCAYPDLITQAALRPRLLLTGGAYPQRIQRGFRRFGLCLGLDPGLDLGLGLGVLVFVVVFVFVLWSLSLSWS